jgi:hypothetical protein
MIEIVENDTEISIALFEREITFRKAPEVSILFSGKSDGIIRRLPLDKSIMTDFPPSVDDEFITHNLD